MTWFKQRYQSPLGPMVLVGDEQYLTGLFFEDQPALVDITEAQVGWTKPQLAARDWLDDYFAGHRPAINRVPIKPELTPFRTKVIQALQRVPYGQTTTYRQLSDRIQAGVSQPQNKARAVGGAVGHNPILLFVPCHRVIGQDGSLTGYSAGLARKKWLLGFER
ncbi:methylated-DNA--[protein]-cysteine S-methyltransferase [Lactobacillaceae bacterium L1_55_11]|nr:methylated-DNA--[protein]-cysteine S-methyltransferase [Lactobacillaceae bacterium L1_55_11]